jgi:hypothetical protein
MKTLKNFIALFLLVSLTGVSALAQNGTTGTGKSQAVLTIRVNVAQVVMSQEQTAKAQDHLPVSFSIPVSPLRYSVTETTREEAVHGRTVRVVMKTVVAE